MQTFLDLFFIFIIYSKPFYLLTVVQFMIVSATLSTFQLRL